MRSTPAGLLGWMAFVQCVAILVSGSRIGSILVILYFLFFCFEFVRSFPLFEMRTRALGAGLAGLALTVAVSAIFLLGADRTKSRFLELAGEKGLNTIVERAAGADLARDMFVYSPLFGVGAGGYRHIEPLFSARHPAAIQSITFEGPDHYSIYKYRMHDAHNDYAQLIAELGCLGFLPFVVWGASFLNHLFGAPSGSSYVIAWKPMTLVLALFAAVDFPSLNPAVTSTFCITTIAVLILAEIEGKPRSEYLMGDVNAKSARDGSEVR